MKLLVATLFLILPTTALAAPKLVYSGNWTATNRGIGGNMTCDVSLAGKEQVWGHFYGVWQGVPFDNTILLRGTTKNLQGRINIDGVDYQVAAYIDKTRFLANFTSGRYVGNFDLKRVRRVTMNNTWRIATVQVVS